MAKRKRTGKSIGTFTGRVLLINVKGDGPNSAQLEFSLISLDEKDKATFIVGMGAEGRVFNSMSTVLAMAYRAALPVSVTYRRIEGGTPVAIELQVPAWED